MTWTQTYTGRAFTPLDPRPDDVRLDDIAHSLSLQCRFNGHCRHHYSVAQHSIYVALALPVELFAYGIIHDAAEAYVGDMVRPIKELFPAFRDLEDRIMGAICAAVGLPWPWPEDVLTAVKRADAAVLAAEAQQIMAPHPLPWAPLPAPPEGLTIREWSPRVARDSFLALARSALPAATLDDATPSEADELRGIIRRARQRLYDAHGRGPETTAQVIRAVGAILREEGPDAL